MTPPTRSTRPACATPTQLSMRRRASWLTALLLLLIVSAGCDDATGAAAVAAQSTEKAAEKAAVTDVTTADEKPDYAAVFDGDVVRTIHITMTASEWKRMQDDMVALLGEPTGDGTAQAAKGGGGGGPGGGGPAGGGPGGGGPGGGGPGGGGGASLIDGDPTWVDVTVKMGDRTLQHAGMRFKGNSSLSQSWQQGIKKLPFRMTFDKFEDDHAETKNQRLHGFKKLTFAPGFADSSCSRDKLMEELLVGRGLPAARTAYYRVMLDIGDGKGAFYAGLYTVIEDPSDAMMTRIYGDDSGNLYKPDGASADWAAYTGAWADSGFIKKNNEKAADWTDIAAALSALHADAADAAAWRTALQQHFDVDAFLNWLALNTVVVNWDVYGAIAHNYYLYHEPGARLVWVPWDHNMSLTTAFGGGAAGDAGADVLHTTTTDKWPLIRLLLDDPVFLAAYKGYVSKATEGLFEAKTFRARAEVLHALVKSHVLEEKAPWSQLPSAAAFEGAVDALDSHVQARHLAVAAALK